ncbi:MAG TPA: DNA polymerase IV [Planctomycetota bacterium]|nr:DNA polymerase IV [Planctomycetota bacterium]
MLTRQVLHADMDAFYAAIEQRDNPALRGKPVIVGGEGRRGVVATASYEARTFGVRSAMPGSRARALCPSGIFVAPRMDVYAGVSEHVFRIFERYTPLVEPLSLDEAFLDVTGSRALFGDGAAIASRIRADVRAETGLTVSVGVATSKYVAKVASDLRKPDALVVVPDGTERAFLAPLPVGRLWGAGPVTQKRLAEAGIATIGDVARLSLGKLAGLVGEAAADHYHALALGLDPREVEPLREARSISHETTFHDDVAGEEALRRVLLELSEAVGRRLRRLGIAGSVVRLKLRYPPFETHTRQRKLDAPTDDDLVVFRTARALLEGTRPKGRPVRLLGVGVADLTSGPRPRQALLFEEPRATEKSRDLLRAMDRIKDRFGDDAIGHA